MKSIIWLSLWLDSNATPTSASFRFFQSVHWNLQSIRFQFSFVVNVQCRFNMRLTEPPPIKTIYQAAILFKLVWDSLLFGVPICLCLLNRRRTSFTVSLLRLTHLHCILYDKKRYISRTIHSAYYVHFCSCLFIVTVSCISFYLRSMCRLLGLGKMLLNISLTVVAMVAMATAMPQCDPMMPFLATPAMRLASRKVSLNFNRYLIVKSLRNISYGSVRFD